MRTDIQCAPGVVTTVALEDGALHTGTTQDCKPYIERAHAMRETGRTGTKDMRLAASVPVVLVEAYCNRAGIDYATFSQGPEHKRRFLNDPSMAHFRIWQGRV